MVPDTIKTSPIDWLGGEDPPKHAAVGDRWTDEQGVVHLLTSDGWE